MCPARNRFVGSPGVMKQEDVQFLLHGLMDDCRSLGNGENYGADKYNCFSKLAVICLGLFNGLRPLEIRNLKWRNLDIDLACLAVKGKFQGVRIGYRTLPLTEPNVVLLCRLKASRQKYISPGSSVFISSTGNSWLIGDYRSPKGLNQIISLGLSRKYENAKYEFYSLRHTFRSDMLEAGLTEHVINYLMGHKRIGRETFNIYTPTLSRDQIREEYKRGVQSQFKKYGLGANGEKLRALIAHLQTGIQ